MNERMVPVSDLDFQLMTTEPGWGKEDIPEHLKARAVKVTNWVDKKGTVIRQDILNQWAIGGMSTRDVRLGNLNIWNGEFQVTLFYHDWGMDALRAFMEDDDSGYVPGAPWVANSRVESVVELSHSKNGFFRRLMNTFFTETKHQEVTPPKKSLFGKPKKGDSL